MKIIKRNIKHATLWFYILAVVCIVIQLLAVEYHFNKLVDREWLSHVSMKTLAMLAANNVADAIALLLPFVLLKPKWRKWTWLVIALETLWCLAQLLYIPTYRDLMPFSSFLLTDNVGGTLIKSTAGALRLADMEVVAPPLLLYIAYRLWFKRGIEACEQPLGKRLWLALLSVVVFLLIRVCITGIHYRGNDEASSFQEQIVNDYCVMWTRQGDYLNNNGAVPYAVYCATTSIFSKSTLSEEERHQVRQYINEMPHYTDDFYASARGKNVIMIVVESLNSWVIDLKINGREVTPVLNSMCRDTVNNIVALKMKSQVKNGRSSDGIFMYNTGLLPPTTQAVTNTHSDVPYPSLSKALGTGYDLFYASCDEPTLWNVRNMSSTYGYKDFYGIAEINDAVKANGYKLDKALLEEVSQLIQQRKQPFMCLVATAGMHHPYNSPMEPTTWVQSSGLYTKEVRCYLEAANAFDTELGNFITRLKASDLYDNTVIVVVSDHNEMVDDNPQGRPSIDNEGDNCVFIAINSGQNKWIEGPVGQIDIYPTLLDLLGLNQQQWKGLGYSLMRNDITSAATSPGITAGHGTLINRQQEAWRVSDMIITSHWFEPQER